MLRVRSSKNKARGGLQVLEGSEKPQVLLHEVVTRGFPELAGKRIRIAFGEVTTPNSYANIRYVQTFFGRLIKAKITVDRTCRDFGFKALTALIAHELSHLLVGDDERLASMQAIHRGFRDGFLDLFAEVCQVPCPQLNETEYGIVTQYNRLNIGGLDRLEFCPLRTRACTRVAKPNI